jgi:TolA-binding protein
VFVALNQPDSARAVLTALSQQYPESRWVAEALKRLQ